MSGRKVWLTVEARHGRTLEGLAGGDPARRGPLMERGRVRYRLGRIHEAIADLSEAAALAHAAGDRAAEADCLLEQAIALDWAGQFPRAADCVGMAAAIAPTPHAPLLSARLALGQGRALFRSSRWEKATSSLFDAAHRAAALGEEGYEIRVVALLLLTTSLPFLGRIEEACAALDAVIALSAAHSDGLHLSAAFTNGRNLRVVKRDYARAVEEQEHSARIGRELRQPKIEYVGEYNLGELKYQAWRPAQALVHVRRAAALEAAHPEVNPHPLAVLLAARIHLRNGELPGARACLTAFRRATAQAASPLGPSETVLAEMVDLATRESTSAEWDGLVERARRDSVEQEPIEVLEARGLAELRAGQGEAARRSLESAYALARTLPNLMQERVLEAVALALAEGGGDRPGAPAPLQLDLSGRGAWLDAEALRSRALKDLAEDDSARRGPLMERGRARYRLGRIQESIADLSEAAALAHAAGDPAAEADCLLEQAIALDWGGQFTRAADCVGRAAAIAPTPHSPLLSARLALGRGRALFRSSRWNEATALLREAARTAAGLGEEGYETRVIALLLLTTSLPYLGCVEEACAALDEVIALSAAPGDGVHLSVAFANGRNLRVSKRDFARAVEDQEHCVRIGRELELPEIEYTGEYNLGELKYQAWRPAQALVHVRRASAIEAAHPEVWCHPVAILLAARIQLRSGDLSGARDRLTEFRRASGQTTSSLGPSEGVLADMVDLATRESTSAEWDGLVERSRRDSVEQEPIEVLEARGLAELRAGQGQAARRTLESASALARTLPNLMEDRVREALALAGGSEGWRAS